VVDACSDVSQKSTACIFRVQNVVQADTDVIGKK
jgi:hypothetical protein